MYNEHMISRKIEADLAGTKKSILLLGPRQVGKSTLIQMLKPSLVIQLADEAEFYAFSSNPSELRTRLDSTDARTILIDEVQRLPSLLNTVQAIIDERRGIKFFLTGTSARKLRRGGANLNPGRLLNFLMGPLVSSELDYKIVNQKILGHGSLPEIYLEKNSKIAEQILKSYVSNYISEEIRAEALVRNLEAFTRFSQSAIRQAGHFVDYSKMAKQAKVPRHSISRFFEIFEDTLIGHRIWPFEPVLEDADLIKHPKFFLFDNGVYNATLGNFNVSSDRIGILTEQLIFSQLLHSAWAAQKQIKISTFRTRGGLEVDFIVELDGEVFAIEVKGAQDVFQESVQSLKNFQHYYPHCSGLFLFHLGNQSKKLDGIWAHPWQKGFKELGL